MYCIASTDDKHGINVLRFRKKRLERLSYLTVKERQCASKCKSCKRDLREQYRACADNLSYP